MSRFLADGRFLDEERVAFLIDLEFESSCGFFDCCFFLLVPGSLEDFLVLDLLRLRPFSLGLDLLLAPSSYRFTGYPDVAFESAADRPAPPPPSRLPLRPLLLISLPRLLLSRLGGGGGLLRI